MPVLAVLEDDPRRKSEIRMSASTHLAEYTLQLFCDAREMIVWLSENFKHVRLLSLDCDLDATTLHNSDCGSGEDVSAYLTLRLPNCPVLIHSSNAMRAPAMHMELTVAGCPNVFLRPFSNGPQWAADVRSALLAVGQP